jgi:hypothetical protein
MPEPPEVTLPIAGAQFHKGARETLASLAPGTRLVLVREPVNKYDPLAIAVWLPAAQGIERQKLGFIPKSSNVEIAWAIASGVALAATFAGCDEENRPQIMIRWPPVPARGRL